MSKGFLDTPIGILEITAENGKIVGVELVRREAFCAEIYRSAEGDFLEKDKSVIDETKKQITEYFAGDRTQFDLDIELRGTEFQKKVWQVLMAIPYGTTLSYGQVAEAAGKPGGQRAAGIAAGRNPLLIVVPCHRVIKADGRIGGFSAGIDSKIILQETEGIL